MQIKRMFLSESFKGTKHYLNTQKKYEILRTVIYFGISLSLFAAGWITTGTKVNLLTIVAILGCLPASKSMVQMIMYLRYKSLSESTLQGIDSHSQNLSCLYDMVFTSYEKNYSVGHLAVKGNTIVGYTEDAKFDEKSFYTHIDQILKKDHIKGTSIKIFSDLKKYTDRLDQLQELDADESLNEAITDTLKCVSL